MGGGGFMHDANKRIQQNRNKLNRSSLFDRDRLKHQGKSRTHLEQKDVSPEDLSALKNRINQRNKAANRRLLRNLIISAVIGVALAIVMGLWFGPQ